MSKIHCHMFGAHEQRSVGNKHIYVCYSQRLAHLRTESVSRYKFKSIIQLSYLQYNKCLLFHYSTFKFRQNIKETNYKNFTFVNEFEIIFHLLSYCTHSFKIFQVSYIYRNIIRGKINKNKWNLQNTVFLCIPKLYKYHKLFLTFIFTLN